jgi:hypothetical protein
VRFDVTTAVNVKFISFEDDTTCNLVEICLRFEGICGLHIQDRSHLQTEVIGFCEALLHFYQTIRRHTSEDSNLHTEECSITFSTESLF